MQDAILLSSSSDIDIMVHGLFSYELFGHTFWITTTHVCMLIIILVLLAFSIAANRVMKRASDVPGGFQNIVELIVEMLDKMVHGVMGKSGDKFVNYIGTIFIFILISNISGLFGLRPPTADYGVTFPLALLSFILIHFNQFKHQTPKEIWVDMCSPLPPWLPIWFPINVISELAVPVSLSLRLFANILSGTIIMALIYALLSKIAYFWPGALHAYFDIFSGCIQTYVFCMLTMTYISNAIGEEE